jgi:hypothetical protein
MSRDPMRTEANRAWRFAIRVVASRKLRRQGRQPPAEVALLFLSLALLVHPSLAADYCTKEQYELDRSFIDSAFKAGTLEKGPKGLRDSILVQESFWFDMNYPEQIAFMQRFECASAGLSGKQFLYMDVRSLATGRLLATWTLGMLNPAEGSYHPTEPGGSESWDETRVGLTGETRARFIEKAVDACTRSARSESYCSCYANVMADSLSIKDLNAMSAAGNQGSVMTAIRPKLEDAGRRCMTN